MVTNRYVNQPDNTDTGFQAEFDKLIMESIQFYGHDVIYMPRQLVKQDDLFGEDTISRFRENGCIEMYIETVEGFQGDGDFLSKFGIEVKDNITLLCSITRWQEESINGLPKPKEGDLIYLPLFNALFEVRFVKDNEPLFFQQNRLYVFRIFCEKFDYSHEELDTGIPEIDSLEEIFENNNNPQNDPVADNADIEQKGDAIKDFAEADPFGDF